MKIRKKIFYVGKANKLAILALNKNATNMHFYALINIVNANNNIKDAFYK